jgi:hypothetical protein
MSGNATYEELVRPRSVVTRHLSVLNRGLKEYDSSPTPTPLTPPRGIWPEFHKQLQEWPS